MAKDEEKCPYCGEIMLKGNIHTLRDSVVWLPAGFKTSVLDWPPPESLYVAYASYFHRGKKSAARCSNCRKIIIDYSDHP